MLPTPAHSDSDQAPTSWWVRAAVITSTETCAGAFVLLSVDPWSSPPLRIPLESDEFNDAEWTIEFLEPGIYDLHAQVVSCDGTPGPLATLEFEYSPSNRRKEIYVGLRFNRGLFDLDYLEISTEWDGSGFLSVERNGEEFIVTNISDVELQRCEYEWAGLYDEYLVGAEWGTFASGGRRDWPDGVSSLKPGKSVTTRSTNLVFRKSNVSPKLVRPSAKRYTVTIQPRRQHYLALTEPKWGLAGLPSCDRYSLKSPITDADPSLEIWDKE